MSRPQFSRRTHRAREHMEALGRRVPDIWSMVEQIRLANAEDIGGPDWPTHCYIPLEHAGVLAATLMRAQGVQPTPSRVAHEATIIATLTAWRMTQGIYRFDPALYPALIDTPLDGDLPASVIQRLPEWCVYIETPGLSVPSTRGALALHGAYVWLDRARGATHDLLTILLDPDEAPLTVTHVPLAGSMRDAIAGNAAQWRSAYARGNAERPPPADYEEVAVTSLTPVVSLILYLCSQASDITGRRAAPGNPEPVRTRRYGMRLYAADGPSVWDVGVRLGAALRAAYQRAETGNEGAGGGVRGHVRRAHWHTILSGARKRPDGSPIPSSERHAELRWMPPIPVALDDYGALPSVVRVVK